MGIVVITLVGLVCLTGVQNALAALPSTVQGPRLVTHDLRPGRVAETVRGPNQRSAGSRSAPKQTQTAKRKLARKLAAEKAARARRAREKAARAKRHAGKPAKTKPAASAPPQTAAATSTATTATVQATTTQAAAPATASTAVPTVTTVAPTSPGATVTMPTTTPVPVPVSDVGGPSGELMPTGDLPGWREVFADDFNGDSLNPNLWSAYSGQPGEDPNGSVWSPSHVVVQNGELVLKGYEDDGQYTTGGVTSQPGLVQTYGKYLVRYRVDQGDGVSHCVLLWPADNVWGPEIDFSEDNGADRQYTTATLHWGAGGAGQQTGEAEKVNLTQWHTLGVEWTPGKVVYTLDGRPWGSLETDDVPNIPMVMDLQTQSWCGAGQAAPNSWEQCMDSSTPAEVDMDVDWVVAYAPAD